MPIVQDERSQLAHVEHDLVLRFGDLPASTVHHEVEVCLRAFEGARVRTFVPVLVHKSVRDTLRRASRA